MSRSVMSLSKKKKTQMWHDYSFSERNKATKRGEVVGQNVKKRGGGVRGRGGGGREWEYRGIL